MKRFVKLGGTLVTSLLFLSAPAFAANKTPNAWLSGTVTSLDGVDWLLGIDPQNVGREQRWFEQPTANARPTRVPWIIQDIFPDYHGVA